MRVSSIYTTGISNWLPLGADHVPHKAYEVILQARTAVDFRVANTQDTSNYVTVKAGSSFTIRDIVQPSDISVSGPSGALIEIVSFTRLVGS